MSAHAALPDLDKIAGSETLHTVHRVARLIGRIRRELSPPHPHWWHVSLAIRGSAHSTGTIGGVEGSGSTPFRLDIDLERHRLVFERESGPGLEWPLGGLVSSEVADSHVAGRGSCDFIQPRRVRTD